MYRGVMSSFARNILLSAGGLWGFVMALVPAEFAFAGSLRISPFLVSAFLCAALSGALGTWVAGRWASRSSNLRDDAGWLRWLLSGLTTGLLQAVVIGSAAALSIWLAMTVTMTGFSTAEPSTLYTLVSQPSIFLQSAIVGRYVLIYALIFGVLLAPFTGLAINRLAVGGAAREAAAR